MYNGDVYKKDYKFKVRKCILMNNVFYYGWVLNWMIIFKGFIYLLLKEKIKWRWVNLCIFNIKYFCVFGENEDVINFFFEKIIIIIIKD